MDAHLSREPSTSISVAVAARLAAISPVVAEAVIEALTRKETDRRVTLITAGIEKLEDEERALRRLGADMKAFTADGTLISESYSKARLDERAKAAKTIEKLRRALDQALAGDMGPLAQNDANKASGGKASGEKKAFGDKASGDDE